MARSTLFGAMFPLVRTSVPGRISIPATIDGLLSSCPSSSASSGMEGEVGVRYDSALFDDPAERGLRCTVGGSETNVRLAFVNTLRVLRAVTFDSPVPLFNSRNLYSWLVASGVRPITIFRGIPGQPSSWDPRLAGIRMNHLFFSGSSRRYWTDPVNRRMGGISACLVNLMHEAWHSYSRKGHEPGVAMATQDPSLEFGGSWAAEYWIARWFAEHSGSWLTAQQRLDQLCFSDSALRMCKASVPRRDGC